MRRIIYALLMLQLSLQAQNQKVTLADCYIGARERHPSYSDQLRIQQINKLKVENAGIQWLPQLFLNGQANYQSDAIDLSIPISLPNQAPTFKRIQTDKDQYKATVDVSQLLFDGGTVKVQKQIAELSTQTDVLQTEVDIHKGKEQVNQVYFYMLILKQNEHLLQTTVNNLLEKRKSIESGVANGLLNENDLRLIDVELMKIKQQIKELQIAYTANVNVLAEITGLKLDTSVQLVLPDSINDVNDSLSRSELLLFESQRKTTDLSKQLLQTQRVPKLYTFGQLGYGKPGLNMLGNEFNTFYIVGVSLKWNIWDWNKTNRDKQVLGLQKEQISSKETQFVRNIKIAEENYRSKIEQLESAVVSDGQIIELHKEIVSKNSLRLDQGLITTTEYLNSVSAETIAKIQGEVHKIQLLQARCDLKILKGN